MAVTRLKRKERRNKTTARVRVENIKRFKSRTYVKSPYESESGIVLESADFSASAASTTATEVEVAVESPAITESVDSAADTTGTAEVESTEAAEAGSENTEE